MSKETAEHLKTTSVSESLSDSCENLARKNGRPILRGESVERRRIRRATLCHTRADASPREPRTESRLRSNIE
eukprot:6187744-Pleurochrysis_carterae.AAC.9